MTLIFLGHEMSQKETSGFVAMKHPEVASRGLFAIADSALTVKSEDEAGRTSYKTLMTGLAKVHEIPIRVLRPDILRNGHFQGFHAVSAYEATAIVAFAGNAHSAHHALNFIREDLGNLRISYRAHAGANQTKGLILVRGRDQNPMNDPAVSFDEDTFLPEHTHHLFKAEFFVKIVSAAIQSAFRTIVEHCNNIDDISKANAAFAFGAWCPVERTHQLFELHPKRELQQDRYQMAATPRLVGQREVVALGTRSVIEALNYQSTFAAAVARGEPPSNALFELMDATVDRDFQSFSGFPINRPLAAYLLKEGSLTRSA